MFDNLQQIVVRYLFEMHSIKHLEDTILDGYGSCIYSISFDREK